MIQTALRIRTDGIYDACYSLPRTWRTGGIASRRDREAIDLANSSHLGLGASVWTGDLSRGEHIARRLEAGATFVNEFVKSDPRLPFGGVKDSGYGRELSRHGIREFVNRKTLWIQHGIGDDEALVE